MVLGMLGGGLGTLSLVDLFVILGDVLGCGGYATVYQAVEMFTGFQVAVKVIDMNRLHKTELYRLQRQVQILQSIHHPNIVRIYEYLQLHQKFYIFMQKIPGKQLFSLIRKRGPLSQIYATKIFHQICLAVKYLHERGIAHRDIKIENIMVDFQYNAKLVDFGLARRFHVGAGRDGYGMGQEGMGGIGGEGRDGLGEIGRDEMMLSTFCGSPSYIAPEVVGRRKYDGRCVDVWCLGVSLYTMLEAALPFDQKHQPKRNQNILNLKWHTPKLSSPESNTLYSQIFTSPQNRPTIHQLLQCNLFKKYHLYEKQHYKIWGLQQQLQLLEQEQLQDEDEDEEELGDMGKGKGQREGFRYEKGELNYQYVWKIGRWLKMDFQGVRREIRAGLGVGFCLYRILGEMSKKGKKNRLGKDKDKEKGEDANLRSKSREEALRKYTRSVRSQNQQYQKSGNSTPMRKKTSHKKFIKSTPIEKPNPKSNPTSTRPSTQTLHKKVPLSFYQSHLSKKSPRPQPQPHNPHNRPSTNQIKLTQLTSQKQRTTQDNDSHRPKLSTSSKNKRSRDRNAYVLNKILQVEFPKIKLRDDSPESPKRILDYVKGYK